MIKKFNEINYGSYENFSWGSNPEFNKVNIFYGRNYSGKTTLSRILRSFDLKKLHDDYENATFEIDLENEKITQNDVGRDILNIRVYNKDFVKDNLSFLIDDSRQEADIKAFSSVIVGESNKNINDEIMSLKQKLGFAGNEENKQANGLRKELQDLEDNRKQKEEEKNNKQKELDESLSEKAKAIKENPNFVKQGTHYDKRTIEKDIKEIQNSTEYILQEADKQSYINIIKDDLRDKISFSMDFFKNDEFAQILNEAKALIEKEIIAKENIDTHLRKWLIEGLNLHENEDKCKFCDNLLDKERLDWLIENIKDDSEEKKELENKIEKLLKRLEESKNKIGGIALPKDEQFYSQNQSKFDELKQRWDEGAKKYTQELKKIEEQIKNKQENIFEKLQFNSTIEDYSQNIQEILEEIKNICEKNNEESQSLNERQEEARKKLRLNEVANFIQEIRYFEKEEVIETLEEDIKNANSNIKSKQEEINKIDKKIEDLEDSLSSEQAGADIANKYLQILSGNQLKFEAIEGKKGEFSILRAEQKAKNLSEGECSLLAFCYFVAKIQGEMQDDRKPIIWIDDPISSLDSNHIFFIFSLIESNIAKAEKFEQIFISTHNLEFLKYLKRVAQEKKMSLFLIEKQQQKSAIKEMPKYLSECVTEFNYLFEKILKCAECENIDEVDHSIGNDMRKFLECYLFFKFPNKCSLMDKIKKFFKDEQRASCVNRLVNEFSHLAEYTNRATMPIDCAEIQEVAKIIIEKIKEKDEEQFNALKESLLKPEKTS